MLLLKMLKQKANKRMKRKDGKLDEAIAQLQLHLTVNKLQIPKANEAYTTQAEAISTLTKNIQKMLKKENKRDRSRLLLDSYDRNYKWIMGTTIVGSIGVIATGIALPILVPAMITAGVKSALIGLAIGTGPFLATMIARFSYFLSGKKEFQPKRTAEDYALETYTKVEIGKDLNKLDGIASGNSRLEKGELTSRQVKKLGRTVKSIHKNITKMSNRDQKVEAQKTKKPDRRPDILYQDEMALNIAKQKFRESNLGLKALHYFVLGPKFGNRFFANSRVAPSDIRKSKIHEDSSEQSQQQLTMNEKGHYVAETIRTKPINKQKPSEESHIGLTPRHQDMLKMMEEQKGQTFPELYDWFRGSLKDNLGRFAKTKVIIREQAI